MSGELQPRKTAVHVTKSLSEAAAITPGIHWMLDVPHKKRQVSFHLLSSASPSRSILYLRSEGRLAIPPLLSPTPSVNLFWVTDPSWALIKNTVYIFHVIEPPAPSISYNYPHLLLMKKSE